MQRELDVGQDLTVLRTPSLVNLCSFYCEEERPFNGIGEELPKARLDDQDKTEEKQVTLSQGYDRAQYIGHASLVSVRGCTYGVQNVDSLYQ